MKVDLSFVITVFNKEKYLYKVIDGLFNQVDTPNVEYIFVDDGSTDNSIRKLKRLTAKNKKARIIKQKNMGLIGATRTGINAAKGKYIIFCDADDVLLPDASKLLLEAAEKCNVNTVTGSLFLPKNLKVNKKILSLFNPNKPRYFSNLKTISPKKLPKHYYILENEFAFNLPKTEHVHGTVLTNMFSHALISDKYTIGATGSLIRTDLAKDIINSFNSHALHTQDAFITLMLICRNEKIVCLDGICAYSLTTSNSNDKNKLTKNNIQVNLDCAQTILNIIELNPKYFIKKPRALSLALKTCLKKLRHCSNSQNKLTSIYIKCKLLLCAYQYLPISSRYIKKQIHNIIAKLNQSK